MSGGRALPVRAQLGIAAVTTAAAVLSFSALRALAISADTWAWTAWLLPVALDAAAGVSMFVWMRAVPDPVTVYARRLTWSSIGLSILGNGAHHGFAAAGMVHLPWYAAVAVGAVPPVMFGAVVHLAVLAVPNRDQDVPAEQPAAAATEPAGTASPAPAAGVPTSAPDNSRYLDDAGTAGLHSVPASRSKRQLIDAARSLRVPRKASETVDDLRARVEAAERVEEEDTETVL